MAYVLAPLVSPEAAPIFAPLTALVVVQVTLYETFTSGLKRVVAVTAGVMVAAGLAHVVPLTWWSLGVAVGVGIVLGRVLRLGETALDVPITAMLLLAVDPASDLGYSPAQKAEQARLGGRPGLSEDFRDAPPTPIEEELSRPTEQPSIP